MNERELDALTAARRVEWAWIKGHSGHAENERCDELAGRARLAQSSRVPRDIPG